MNRKLKISLIILATVVIVLAVAGVAAVARARRRGNIHMCWEYLNLIENAKESVVMTRGLTNEQTVAWHDLDALVKQGTPRECPMGGTLTPGTVGKLPLCSMHGEMTANPIEFERRNGLE